MNKAIVLNGLGLVGVLSAVMLVGVVIGYVVGWTPEYTASVVVGVQMGATGWIVRGWFC
jgi:hypothetical protein